MKNTNLIEWITQNELLIHAKLNMDEFTGANPTRVFDSLDTALRENVSVKHVLIDMSQIVFAASSGIGALAEAARNVNSRPNGKMVVVIKEKKLANMFEMIGLTRVLKIASSVEQALTEFKN